MASVNKTVGQKRKIPAEGHGNSLNKKRQKTRESRDIQVQKAENGLSISGELNVASYVKSRGFEINALEKTLRKARKGLMSRAFQQVPKHMRRRTASHNVKKVPQRFRPRARREMIEDNTPTVNKKSRTPSRKLRLRLETAKIMKSMNQRTKTVRQKRKDAKLLAQEKANKSARPVDDIPKLRKNKLTDPPMATSKYKRRQVHKTWLPTHMWHTKRAHMTKPTEPLWRMAIPLCPTEKSYRSTHRAAGTRGCIAWDKSYMSTIGCLGTESALESMLKSLGFSGNGWSGSKYKRWKDGTRCSQGVIHERDGNQSIIAPATVIWQSKADSKAETISNNQGDESGRTQSEDAWMEDVLKDQPKQKSKLDRRLFIRIHPSAFHQFWLEVLKVAKMQKPQVLVEDLRFEVGSIEVTGPASTEALVGILKPWPSSDSSNEAVEIIWSMLADVTNPAALPQDSLLKMNIQDPRLNYPPKQAKRPGSENRLDQVNQMIISWPPDKDFQPSLLFSHKSRWRVSQSVPSQKAINRRRALAEPGKALSLNDKDPQIPIMLLTTRNRSGASNLQGCWTVLMPWRCVDAVWRSLMYFPLSSGRTPSFGGLKQEQQLAFEEMVPWFPGDFPGIEAGKAWERTQSEERFDEWIRRPPSRRLAWDMVDLGMGRKGEIGRGWTCDWEFLFTDGILSKKNMPLLKPKPKPKATSEQHAPPNRLLTQRQRKAAKAEAEARAQKETRRRNTSSPDSDVEDEANEIYPRDTEPEVDFTQLSTHHAKYLMADFGEVNLPPLAALVTVRAKLFTRGTPSPAARIYRIPMPTTNSSQPSIQSSADLSKGTVSSLDVSMTGQADLSIRSKIVKSKSRDLRSEWLTLYSSLSKGRDGTTSGKLTKDKINHHNLKRKQTTYPRESLEHINVLPRDARPEVIEMYGPKPRTEEQILAEKREKLMAEFMKGDVLEGEWDKHIPCPDVQDLIGFVTSGGYNLGEGRGTAIGSLWVQRMIEGWKSEQKINEVDGDQGCATVRNEGKGLDRQIDKIRHLCIIRNSGESIARLGVWEVCEGI